MDAYLSSTAKQNFVGIKMFRADQQVALMLLQSILELFSASIPNPNYWILISLQWSYIIWNCCMMRIR